MDKNGRSNDNDRIKHYRGSVKGTFSPCGSLCAEDDFVTEGLGRDLFGEPGEDEAFLTNGHGCCEEEVPYPPYVHHDQISLSTGPFILPRSGRLVMRVENPYAECVCAEVRVFDLRCGHRTLLLAGAHTCRKIIKLAAYQTKTVSFDAGIPAGYLLDACVRADGFVMPMLQLDSMNGIPQMLYKTTEFLSLHPHHCHEH